VLFAIQQRVVTHFRAPLRNISFTEVDPAFWHSHRVKDGYFSQDAEDIITYITSSDSKESRSSETSETKPVSTRFQHSEAASTSTYNCYVSISKTRETE
jgi:hypothetical protein